MQTFSPLCIHMEVVCILQVVCMLTECYAAGQGMCMCGHAVHNERHTPLAAKTPPYVQYWSRRLHSCTSPVAVPTSTCSSLESKHAAVTSTSPTSNVCVARAWWTLTSTLIIQQNNHKTNRNQTHHNGLIWLSYCPHVELAVGGSTCKNGA